MIADSDLPPFDRSQMDGYAIRVRTIPTNSGAFEIVGESAAGRGWHQEMQAGEAVRIMTGAPVPSGADSVQQVELTRESIDGSEVEILTAVVAGKSIVKRGDEIKRGETVAARRAADQLRRAMASARFVWLCEREGGEAAARCRAGDG